MMTRSTWQLAALALLWGAMPALAHTGHDTSFALRDGLIHPLAGADHLLAMVAVGVWAAQLGGAAMLALPATFVAAMTLGALAAVHGLTLGGGEAIILASVVVLGAVIAAGRRWHLVAAMAVVGAFAAAHGQAHGLEVPSSGGIPAFVAGFVASTAILHAVGILAGRALATTAWGTRALGGAVSLAGVALAAGALTGI